MRQQTKTYGQAAHVPAILRLKLYLKLKEEGDGNAYFSVLDEQSLSW